MRHVAVAIAVTIIMFGASAPSSAVSKPQLSTLFQDLMKFKGSPEFQRVGFGICCKYNKWLKQVDELDQEFTSDDFRRFKFVPGDLKQLGLEYMKSQGRETDYTRFMTKTIRSGLASK